MDVPIEPGRNEAVKTLGLIRNPSSYVFLIIKVSCIQKLREPNNSPVSKSNIFSIIAAIVDPFV